MDLQRSLLIGAIAVLSFMLLTEWVAFKDDKAAIETAQATRLIANTDSNTAELPQVSEPALFATDDDVPSTPELIEAEAPPQITQKNSGRIILVRTDSLQLAIDLNGGDIIELALPRYLEEIDNPDIPFVLLEQNDSRTYIAQSGLIGSNGIDSKGRALFTASADNFELSESDDTLVVDLNLTTADNIKVTKRFTFTRGEYLVEIDYIVVNNSNARWQANLFGQIKRDSTPAPICVYREPDLIERSVRSFLTDNVGQVICDNEQTTNEMRDIAGRISRRAKRRIQYLPSRQSIFEKIGIQKQIDEAFSRQVWLKCGGYLVIDETEAMITVDVNTGRFTGRRNQEETIFQTNMLAAREVAT